MTDLEHGELRVVVPVGFLLDSEQEVTVSVDRPDGQPPLPIRLKLVPARTEASEPSPMIVDDTAVLMGWRHRRNPRRHAPIDDGYPGFDVGGGD